MMFLSINPNLGQLDARASCAVLQAAADDLESLAHDVLTLTAQSRAEPDRLARLARAQHALSGLCRLVGADALEQSASRSLLAEVDRFAFVQCLQETLGALNTLRIRLERECPCE